MNLRIFTRAKLSSRIGILIVALLSLAAAADGWKIDLSRRVKEPVNKELSENPDQAPPASEKTLLGTLGSLFDSSEPLQEVVILHTDKGFVPATVRVRQGGSYRLHVVNVNEREKNVSFVLDSFSEHHATYFGKIKSFEIHPKKNGVFRFVSPETSAQGRLVVYPGAGEPISDPPTARQPASEE